MFAPLRHRQFRLLWLATMVCNLGALIQAVAAGWVMTELTGSSQMVALVQAAMTLPIMLFSITAGALADSFDRRKVMLVAQSLMLTASLGLWVQAVLGLMDPWWLLGFVFVVGAGTALHNPSWQASVGDLVPRPEIAGAVTLNGMGFNLMRSIGPAIGGVIIAAAGASLSFALNAASYLPLILALSSWKPDHPRDPLPREQLMGAIGAGFRYISMSPDLQKVMVRSFLFGFSAICILALLPIIANDLLSGGSPTFGGLLGAFGAGGISGAASNARLRARFGNEAITRIASSAFALSMTGLALSTNPVLSHVLVFPAGASWVVSLSLFNAVVQLSTPRWVVGRMLSMYQTCSFGGMALGSWTWGALAESRDVQSALVAAAVVMSFSALTGLRLAVPNFRTTDLAPLDGFDEPDLKLDVNARSGPIMIVIDYAVSATDVPAFLAAMTHRRRIRIRDGAHRWTLLRDVENPQAWTETYQVATWVDYVRHIRRRTRADAECTRTLHALHRGDGPPRVRRLLERHRPSSTDDPAVKPHIDLYG